MAGTGPLAGRVSDGGTSNLTPTYAVPDTSRLYEQTGETLAALTGSFQAALAARAARAGQRAGMEAAAGTKLVVEAGQTAERPKAGHGLENFLSGGAYQRAFEMAALVKLKNDIDNHDEVLRAQHQYDPQAYQTAAGKAKSGFIQGSPEELAVDVEAYATSKFDGGYSAIARVAQQRATQEAAHDLGVRVKVLDEKLMGLAASGTLDSMDFEQVHAERATLQFQREHNPAILYGEAERAYDDDSLYDALHGASSAHQAILAAAKAGGGQPGRAAGSRLLKAEILGEGTLPPTDGLKVEGNLDPWNRPVLKNPDGSYSTTSSISIGTDQGEVLIPTVVDGKRLTQAEAIQHYWKTGQHLGIFDTPEHADTYSQELHNRQAAFIESGAGTAFKDIDPGRRMKIYSDAKKQVDAFTQADIEQRRDEERKEAETRAEERETVGSLLLQVGLGGVSEASVLKRDDISDRSKASLVSAIRAQSRRAATDARAAAAMERAGAVATYREYSDAADAGTLSEGEIAEALHAGFITPGKARTLAAKRDKSLKPVIEDVMAPVKDAGSKGGRRPSEVKTSIAEEAAAIWAARNPGATLDERLKAGAAIAQRVYGAPKSTPGPTPNDSPAKQGKFDALKAQHRAGKLDNSTYLRRIQELNSHAH